MNLGEGFFPRLIAPRAVLIAPRAGGSHQERVDRTKNDGQNEEWVDRTMNRKDRERERKAAG